MVIINMLTRYARTQFLSPNQNVSAGSSGCPGSLQGGGVKGGCCWGWGCKASHLPAGVLAGGKRREGLLRLRGGGCQGCQGRGGLVGQAQTLRHGPRPPPAPAQHQAPAAEPQCRGEPPTPALSIPRGHKWCPSVWDHDVPTGQGATGLIEGHLEMGIPRVRLPPGAAGWDSGGHSHPSGCPGAHWVTLGCVPTGGDGRGTALLPPGTQSRGWRHCQGAGAAPAESQVCGTWVVVVPTLPLQLAGPIGNPKTLGEIPKKPIPAGTSGLGKLPKKRAFFLAQPSPGMGWQHRGGTSLVVGPAPSSQGLAGGVVQPCPADSGPLLVPTARCSMSCCRTWPPCPSNGG